MQLLGYMNVNDGYPEKGVKVEINGGATKGKTCTLTTEELTVSSSAVYFSAASHHSAACHCFSVQKPHSSVHLYHPLQLMLFFHLNQIRYFNVRFIMCRYEHPPFL